MRSIRYTILAALFLILVQISYPCFGQLGFSFDIKKPKEYEDRVLRSEKTDQKKFTLPRRFIQNTVTHYNYFFNANNKLNEVLERAKTAHTDDFSKLLPFYNYTLDVTAADSVQLDSISYKSQTGIALHDLRNDWIDNLYLLWGAAYYLRKQFDSAYLMFQFINYAFAEKEKDGYYRTIGSNRDGNSAYSISTKEKRSLPKRIFTEPPSRNESFIWQIRNFLAQDQFAEAASLIVTLKNDPVFPKRLHNDLNEVQAYWFYKQNMWDSAAAHLELALGNATKAQEKARWEYLLAQLYELTGKYKEAEKYYVRVSSHTTDPIMDIYARLYAIRVNKDGGEKNIEKNIADLVRMAKRDKYSEYRDIIYYMAAQMELERNNIDGALALLLKSTQAGGTNLAHRNKAFLQLAELSYARREYRNAYNFYDSLQMNDPLLLNKDELLARKEILGKLATQMEIIERQDSLQRIAAMPEAEREEFVKKLVRLLRKQQGLKEEPMSTGSPFATQSQTLFPSNEPKGEWYFYNASSRTRGSNDFRTRWGNRPNVDNWRRSGAIAMGVQGINTGQVFPNASNKTNVPGELTYDALYGNLPLTPELVKLSDDSLQAALFELGKLYIQDIEDCSSGTETYEKLRTRFPTFIKMDEVLFNLYYCYTKNGESVKVSEIKKLMNETYPGSNFTTIVTTGKNPKSFTPSGEATSAYEKIYDLFIEGDFDKAVAEKKIADSLYGKNYWTPQLLYIEAVYYIRQREDSVATSILNNILQQFPSTALSEKSATMIDVLSRRAQIEEELRNLVVERPVEDTTTRQPAGGIVQNPVVVPPVNSPVNTNTTTTTTTPPVKKDTIAVKPVEKPVGSAYIFKPEAGHYVLLVLNKVDPVFVNEAKNAFARYNREAYYNKQMTAELVQLDGDNRLLLISPFTNAQEAVEYVERTRPKTASEIIPWLRGGKYSFSIITESNLNLLKTNKDLEVYSRFLNQNLPGKF